MSSSGRNNVRFEGEMNHNSDSVIFRGLHYDGFRGDQIRGHNRLYHEYDDTPPLHIPVELDGVKP